MNRWHCCTRPKAEGNSVSGHPQHRGCDSFDCCTDRYEIVVLLPNSELTKGNYKRAMLVYGSLTKEDHGRWALKTPNNFSVCGQKRDVWVSTHFLS